VVVETALKEPVHPEQEAAAFQRAEVDSQVEEVVVAVAPEAVAPGEVAAVGMVVETMVLVAVRAVAVLAVAAKVAQEGLAAVSGQV